MRAGELSAGVSFFLLARLHAVAPAEGWGIFDAEGSTRRENFTTRRAKPDEEGSPAEEKGTRRSEKDDAEATTRRFTLKREVSGSLGPRSDPTRRITLHYSQQTFYLPFTIVFV